MTRELDYRANNGLEVVLLWDCRSRNLTVEVHDAVSGDEFTLPVDAAHALDAFLWSASSARLPPPSPPRQRGKSTGPAMQHPSTQRRTSFG